ncbi:MAG: histidine kinase [Solirubrobacterales bacterium]|nr:histidine kinase [Solirubrobacterales bacterium]
MRRRGRHKVFLGMAAGVGKTYRMLQEGQAEAEAGRDVVIGYLEPHDRPETAALAVGLEAVHRLRIVHGGVSMDEMDVDAVIERAPELALVDELAHTNAPGTKHEKRYEDVEAVLNAGIDVFSTVNVQHLESLNDDVVELTGTRVREVVPDAIVGGADEVVLIDLTVEALLERLRAGKIYPEDRIGAALQNFFRIEALQSLRELALRQVAEDVESKRIGTGARTRRAVPGRVIGTDAAQAIGERLLALVTPRPESQRLVRRAWRSAQRLGTELDVLWVNPSAGRPRGEQRAQLEALRRLTSVLGAHLLVEHGELLATVRRVAAERGTTYVLLGQPSHRGPLRRWREPLPMRLIEALPGIDIRIVADRTRRHGPRIGEGDA